MGYLAWYVVDIPIGDDWSFLEDDALPSGLTLDWLFKRHNEHIILWTKVQHWVFLKIFDWNISLIQLFNFLLYGALIASVLLVSQLISAKFSKWLPLFLIFLLVQLNWENHSWAFQSQFHLVVIFANLTVYFLFSEESPSLKNIAIASVTSFACLTAFSSGVAVIAFLAIFFGLYSIFITKKYKAGLMYCGLAGVGCALWLLTHRPVGYHSPAVYPWHFEFWAFFLNLSSFGLGLDGIHTKLSAVYSLVLIIPCAILLLSEHHLKDRRVWILFATVAVPLGMIATVAVGRAGTGLGASKVSRYSEFALLLTPYTALAWALLMEGSKLPYRFAMMPLALFLMISFANNWSWEPAYRKLNLERKQGIQCLHRKLAGVSQEKCLTIYPWGIPQSYLDNAKKLNVSFFQKLNEEN